jgi:hypothetical protein
MPRRTSRDALLAGGAPLPPGFVAAVRDLAERNSDIAALHLFGSRARGEARPDSDVDVAIEFAAPTREERLAAWICTDSKATLEAIGPRFGLILDVDSYEPGSDGVVAPAVEQHGVELYRRALV